MTAGVCENCNERPATVKWLGNGGVLAMTHGWTKDWCEQCAVEAQIPEHRKAADRLPLLEARLNELKSAELGEDEGA